MRHWNHRILKRVICRRDTSEDVYGVHECHYDSQGKIWSCSEEPCAAVAESLDELRGELERMQRAFKSPVLDYDKLPEPGAMAEESEGE